MKKPSSREKFLSAKRAKRVAKEVANRKIRRKRIERRRVVLELKRQALLTELREKLVEQWKHEFGDKK